MRPFLLVIRELNRAQQAFHCLDARLLREHELTVPQADILFTLGNTPGMTFGELCERTLTTKGTLTGVVDRLEARGLVRRAPHPCDRRSTLAVLTPEGQALFERIFPVHLDRLEERFATVPPEELEEMARVLRRLRDLLA